MIGVLAACCAAAAMPSALAALVPSENTLSAVALIANYDSDGHFTGWGSGFFVDEGIVITNKHVIDDATYYRVFGLGADHVIDRNCYRTLTKSGVKINRDDDVAYMRAYLDCPHGTVYFANADPKAGDAISVLGFPFRTSFANSLVLSDVSGVVTGTGDGPWMTTDALLDFGNSGGPVVKDDKVVGVAVAKEVLADGTYVSGLFIPVSEIIRGLENANDPSFGYTPQMEQRNPAYQLPGLGGAAATTADCVRAMGDGAEAADNGQCRCKAGYHKDPTATMCAPNATSSRSASSSSSLRATVSTSAASRVSSSSDASTSQRASSTSRQSSTASSSPGALQQRTCERVLRLFAGNATMLGRVNARLQKRFSFTCTG